MKRNDKNRRGFTLAELVVALAVVAILSVMVASFATLIRRNTERSSEQLDALNEIEVVESLVENWIEKNSDATESEVKDSIKISDGKLIVGSTNIDLSTVHHIDFEVVGDDDKLFICIITYFENETYTFCVNPYAGEIVNTGVSE